MRSTGFGMASRLFAVWLIGLIALPFTAPFAAFDAFQLLSHRNICCEAPVVGQGVHAGQEQVAVSRHRSDFLRLSKLRPFVATPYYVSTAILAVCPRSLALAIFPIERHAPLKTVLRI